MTPSNDASECPLPSLPAVPSFVRRWWIYQGERFPVLAHGPLIAAFSFCAVSLSRLLRGHGGWPRWPQLVVAFITCLAYFLQLRIADEFKDFQDDLHYRPYRPVQRGLVTLRQLGVLFVIAALVQLALALWLNPRLVILLGITWIYLAAMSKEFFVAEWLRQRHLLYMLSHMVIMPLVDLYATGTDWMLAGAGPPPGLLLFLLASYCNGLVIELGRKIRSPHDEEHGVATYSHLWGRPIAVFSWWSAMAATMAFALCVAWRVRMVLPIGAVLMAALLLAIIVGSGFLRHPNPSRGKRIETFSGLWTLCLYLSLGLMSHLCGRGAI